jgi:hypothetical protein
MAKKVGKMATGRESRSFPHFLGGRYETNTGFLTLNFFFLLSSNGTGF